MLILFLAILLGFVTAVIHAGILNRRLNPPDLQLAWILPAAIGLQLVALRFGTDNQAAIGLVVSQIAILIFAAVNVRHPGFKIFGLGFVLNFLVISLNGGLMPISPEMVQQLGHAHVETGLRMGKDIILPDPDTQLSLLSDRFYLKTPWQHYAYSLGDIFIALGGFWIMGSTGGSKSYDNFNWRKGLNHVRI